MAVPQLSDLSAENCVQGYFCTVLHGGACIIILTNTFCSKCVCIDCVLYFKDEGAFYDELNTVSQLLTDKKCSKDVKIKKWRLELSEYRFDVEYRP